MCVQSKYSRVLEMYLKKYRNITIHLNQQGEIQKIEKEENGYWKTVATQKKPFEKLPIHTSIYNTINF
jgi:hypothetical protein